MKPLTADLLIGVIDLRQGHVVHAIAGNRERYAPLRVSGQVAIDGQPRALVDFYRGLGLTKFYVADLNAIEQGTIQTELLIDLLRSAQTVGEEWLLDIGCPSSHDDPQSLTWMREVQRNHDEIRWIASTESGESPDELNVMCDALTGERVVLGLDYRKGVFIGNGHDDKSWSKRAAETGVRAVVALDVSSVGTGDLDATVQLCEHVAPICRANQLTLISGGGVSDASDARTLLDSGCASVLVASWLIREGRSAIQ